MNGLRQRIEDSRLLQNGGKILVAVSGGLDSMALLHALHGLSREHQWQLSVAHFNHQLRGAGSDADEKLVRQAAAKLKLPAVVGRADVRAFARRSKLSVEMAARKLRHEFFARRAKQRGIPVIALAHHADDQVELFFLRVLRGAGGEGLSGMKPRAPSPADKKITLIRPLLGADKDELRQFVRENKIAFREDASNSSSEFLRNRIRHQLLPLLRKDYQPGLAKTVLRLMEIIGAESDFVGNVASGLCPDPVRTPGARHIFAGLPVAIQRRILQSQIMKLGLVADFDLVEQLRKSGGKFVSVGAGLSILRGTDGRLKLRKEQPAAFNPNEFKVNLTGRAGRAEFGGLLFDWRLETGAKFTRPPRPAAREIFDAGKVGSEVVLRHWRPGDRFQPTGFKAAAKLQDLFTNRKIPRARRRDLIVAATSGGEIFWVEGLRMAENFKLTPQTRRRLVWHWAGIGG